MRITFVLLIVSTSSFAAEPAIKLPAEITVAPGRIARITAETTGKAVRWLCINDDADLVPVPDGKLALFCAPKAGRYAVYAWTAADDLPSEAAKCTVIVVDPTPPAPPDPFQDDLRKLFHSDTTTDKSLHVAQLAALYREAVAFANKAEITTAGDLAARLRTAASTLLPAEALTGLRKRIAEEIAKALPADGDKPLDAATRAAAGKLFTRIAVALEGLQ